jgi:hypothetical protein
MVTENEVRNRFPLDIVVEKRIGGWELVKPFCYVTHGRGAIWIEPGFYTDFASIPQILWNIYPPFGDDWIKAAVAHDGIYAAERFKRSTCDWVFLEALQDNGANWFDRNVFYTSVRSGGWNVWRKHTEATKEAARKFVSIITLDELADRITIAELRKDIVTA